MNTPPANHNAKRRAAAGASGSRIFTAHGLTKIYTTGEVPVHALRGLDLEVSAGEVVVLLGPSA